jgi:dsRNA-specific ribonuclease
MNIIHSVIDKIDKNLADEIEITDDIEKLFYDATTEFRYERLEFFGDGCLNKYISHYLYKNNSELKKMGKIKTDMCSNKTFSDFTRKLGLDKFMDFQFGFKEKIYGDIFESFIGAFCLSFGDQLTEKLVFKIFDKFYEEHDDYVSILKEYSDKKKYKYSFKIEMIENGGFSGFLIIDGKRGSSVKTGSKKKDVEYLCSKEFCEKYL